MTPPQRSARWRSTVDGVERKCYAIEHEPGVYLVHADVLNFLMESAGWERIPE